MKIKCGPSIKKNTLINGSTKILKETFGHMLIISGWMMHKLRKFVGHICNILASQREVLKASHNGMILCRI